MRGSTTKRPGDWHIVGTFALVHKVSEHPERSREALKYFKYSLRYGGLQAVQNDYIPLPEAVTAIVRSSWNAMVDEKGVPIYKD